MGVVHLGECFSLRDESVLNTENLRLDCFIPLVSLAAPSICSPVDSGHNKHSMKISSDLSRHPRKSVTQSTQQRSERDETCKMEKSTRPHKLTIFPFSFYFPVLSSRFQESLFSRKKKRKTLGRKLSLSARASHDFSPQVHKFISSDINLWYFPNLIASTYLLVI